MKNFDNIKKQLDAIISTTSNIVNIEQQEEQKLDAIDQLMAKRDQQLQALYRTDINKHQLTEEQRDIFRDFFSRFYVLDKKMNSFFSKLSLYYKDSIREMENYKEAEQVYSMDEQTSAFLNTQISG